jgi:hypothetical protein
MADGTQLRRSGTRGELAYEDEMKLDDSYFARNYRPLSNLPTPPLSSKGSTATLSSDALLSPDEVLNPAYLGMLLVESSIARYCLCSSGQLTRVARCLGAAVHLTNFSPPSASLTTPSVPLVHAILSRAGLPHDTIALAVCILDSLDRKFCMRWRLNCPLTLTRPELHKRHTLPLESGQQEQVEQQHVYIDTVQPEIIILSTLIIAFKFLDDCSLSTAFYAANWGGNLWTCQQINVTERCIMEALSYRLMPLWKQELIHDALRDIEAAGEYAIMESMRVPSPAVTSEEALPGHDGLTLVEAKPQLMSSGQAVLGVGEQITPMETPLIEEEVGFHVTM